MNSCASQAFTESSLVEAEPGPIAKKSLWTKENHPQSNPLAPKPQTAPRRNLAKFVRSKTGEGRELVEFMLDILNDNVTDRKNAKVRCSLKNRMDAAKWLGERGWGKPTAVLDANINNEGGPMVLQLVKWADNSQAQSLPPKSA
ncbi:hypothetical protein [uncultured Mediterranean phage uvDeep-CGR2-AD3-C191]|nr:hypothetical protein [uncultured Mediterranean phage uvDeep-CGR2-AD3-C191]